MKYLKIKNRTASPLYFVFCTLSSCTCEVCNEWLRCENAPIAGRPGATFGELRVEPFAERVDRFCGRWQCKGACYYDAVPSTVHWSALYDYNTSQDYSVGTGKADLSFTYSGASVVASSARRMKYLVLKNHSAERLYFVYCTTSQCRCNVCQEWLRFETVPVVDCAGWTVGFVRVEPFSTKMERFCAQWDCMGCCFFGSQPHAVTKAMLFDYDENTNYTIGGGKAALEFTHTAPESSAPESSARERSARQSGLKLATTVGRVALALGGVSDGGVLGDVVDFVGSIFDGGP